ncbi:hypothetical protein H8B06_03275 [Sphingobacterium sp. DN00404]|uniref:Uncharacterized protein n=1 Tax=Sphingobacterium micropteri TaxID=2763501 RepID=A0ABR7YKI0_9SPHI|nr:hypothetical protein [Sphingobacterium micropteri]MBD1431835.1 hypothetical protein [Sphingobacterium micropteri]
MENNSLLINEANVLLNLLAKRYNYDKEVPSISDLSAFKDTILNISWNDVYNYGGERIYIFLDEEIVINFDNQVYLHVSENFVGLKEYFEGGNQVSA